MTWEVSVGLAQNFIRETFSTVFVGIVGLEEKLRENLLFLVAVFVVLLRAFLFMSCN
jgi:hypothetical protein